MGTQKGLLGCRVSRRPPKSPGSWSGIRAPTALPHRAWRLGLGVGGSRAGLWACPVGMPESDAAAGGPQGCVLQGEQ